MRLVTTGAIASPAGALGAENEREAERVDNSATISSTGRQIFDLFEKTSYDELGGGQASEPPL